MYPENIENKEKKELLHRVISLKFLTASTFIIRMERREMDFLPGQYLVAGPENSVQEREYSIYSGINDPWIEILVKRVGEGDVSIKLSYLKPGEMLRIRGPFGLMVLPAGEKGNNNYRLLATGTGIAPFHSFVRSFPAIDYLLIHGVRYAEEAYGKEDFDQRRHVLCTSRDNKGDFRGRVTGYFSQIPSDERSLWYLCGNSSMIYSIYRLLGEKSVPASHIGSEVYF